MAGFLDAFLGTSDADVRARIVGTWNSDFGGSLKLQLLQLLSILTNNETVVLFRDGDRCRSLEERGQSLSCRKMAVHHWSRPQSIH